MTTVDTILGLARKASSEGIALDIARLCTVCWTVHVQQDCPECSARQWLHLAPLLNGFSPTLSEMAENDKVLNGLRRVS